MGLMALALGLDEGWFADKIDDHITGLTALHYPVLDQPALPGQSRRGEHTDWGSITILHHDGQPGLQVMTPEGAWEDAPVVPGAFVVNLGDLMAAWTNDRWRSTMHRVVVPDGAGDRVSIAFFHQPDFDARIECIPTCTSTDDPPRHPPTTSGKWIMSMLERTTC
jgi:isopenicillin N synthase-like dioxygenase